MKNPVAKFARRIHRAEAFEDKKQAQKRGKRKHKINYKSYAEKGGKYDLPFLCTTDKVRNQPLLCRYSLALSA